MLKFEQVRLRLAAALAAAMMASAAPAAVVAAAPESPGTALSRHIRVLASNPRDFNSLIGAGRAALDLGDVEAAAGFFGRAEEANPNAPAAKAGLGAAMAHMGDADGAIFYFDQATRLGAPAMTLAADRGLARDLRGDLSGAQADYRVAISALNSDEARRRLALSLAIGRDRAGALAAIQPLLNRRDPAAQRTRAFVLALVGDKIGAAQAIEAAMPGGSARFAPFFQFLPNLSVPEKAAAVHLGIFPENAAARVAQAQSQQAAAQPPARPPAVAPPVRVAVNTTPPLSQPRRAEPAQSSRRSTLEIAGRIPPRDSRRAAPSVRLAENKPAAIVPSPSFTLPSARSATPTVSNPAPAPIAPPDASSAAPALDLRTAEASAATAVEAVGETSGETGGNLSGIDKLLATLEDAPPPPQPKLEPKKPTISAQSDKVAKAAAARKAAEKKAREEKLAAEKKAREEAAPLGIAGTHWVQLAGGSNQDRMAAEYKKLSGKAGKLLKRPGYVTEGKDYFRLLIGPFDSRGEAQAFVNKLAKEGVDGFSWTRTPPKIKIEKLKS